MNESLISIIMPVYNTGKYLERCLNSIINQTHKNWELIAVNDGSTDNSSEILRSYAQKDNRIIVLEQENQGQSVARNKALDIVKGEYICFVDSDDWVETDYLEELYKAIIKANSEIAICSFYYTTDKAQKLGYKFRSDLIPLCEYKSKLIKDQIKSYLWSCIFKKKLFEGLRFKASVILEDFILFNKILEKLSTNIGVADKPLYHYFLREDSSTRNENLKRDIDYFEAFKMRYELSYISKEEKAYCLSFMIRKFMSICKYDGCEAEIVKINYLKAIDSSNILLLKKALKLIPKVQFLKYKLARCFPIIFKIFPKLCALKKSISKFLPQKRKSFLDNYSTETI